ncbi:peptidoglycan-N-acetylglucosamine deacetylase [Bacillus cytotoxicus]|uniref:Polysaccharide deacetylase n=2 Tax=Bacillus cytotoxicus TaxID=580165 RepID=A0AAX2CJH3_9BACI|nr:MULTISPECIES: polysaccharide deacetylase family protein [Bacillus cereus group]ABS22933.1 polysaccharide deacetylase [Bacillus cytotoxicus NVH 391-98]AWC33601.1 polysaccharide deacetylase [Bacillus cytotoxicus]AWC37578.1 polysaccharide deacetylase [Bacillus cytotoxicus]AWC45564.1 polysaccharide deacetylase [Bacillus cytotoxicus]AWC61799.1 polysaccharide deacetylase [Bacillus cytotoxicus]
MIDVRSQSQRAPFVRRLVIIALAMSTLAAGFFLFHSFTSPAKAVANQVNIVQMASEQSKVELAKQAPVKFNGQVRKVAYLTFDDGPSEFQKEILDILKKNEIKATFFMIGSNISSHSESVKRLVKEGHYPGVHSMTHNYAKLYKQGQFVEEMKQAQNMVKDITGIHPKLVRCPYGSMPGLNQRLRDQMVVAGMKEWDWTIDSLDWKLPGNPNGVVQNVISGANQDREVILMHEKKQTVQALQTIINDLRKKGYEFETYEESAHFPLNFWHDNRI